MSQSDLGSARIVPLTLKLCLPTALSQAVMVLYSIVDRMFIGHIEGVGDLALAGVGVAAPLTTLVTAFGMLTGLGGSPLMAMKEGHEEHESALSILSSAFYMLLFFSILLTPLLICFRYPLLYLFGASSITIEYAERYLFWYLLGTPAALLTTGLNYFLIGQGRSRVAMVSVLSGAALNIILDPVFIFALDLGVSGGAIATVISQLLSAMITVVNLASQKSLIPLSFRRFDKESVLKITQMGLSPFLIAATDSLLFIFLNAQLQKYGGEGFGDMLLTASTIILSYYQLSMNPLIGITGGSQGIISFNYGAGKTDRVRETFRTIQIISIIYTAIMTVMTYVAGQHFIALFTKDQEIQQLTLHYLKIYTLLMVPLSFHYVNVDTLTALGKYKLSLPVSLFRKLVFLLACLILPPLLGAGSAFASEPVSDITAAIVSSAVMYTRLPKILRQREENGLDV